MCALENFVNFSVPSSKSTLTLKVKSILAELCAFWWTYFAQRLRKIHESHRIGKQLLNMKPFGGEKTIPLLLSLHHPIMPLPLQQFMCRWAWLICLISLWSPAPWTDREKKNNKGELISAQPFIYLLQALKKPFLAGLRVGEAFQTTEILVSSGERTPCQLDSPNAYSGKTDFRI